jgi:carbon-monoxide dehydrogenase medium subunit
MKRLREFAYHEPETLDEAIRILDAGDGEARALAGGTDLVVDMKTGRMRPATVVNLKRIPGLTGIEAVPNGTRIGALTTVHAIADSPLVASQHAALAQAAGVLASPPVRALATIGGNIGRASPASDLAPALMVLGATAAIAGPGGERQEPVETLYTGPGTTSLGAGEVITGVILPAPDPRTGSSHLKIGTRLSGIDIAMVAVSTAVTLEPDGTIGRARIALASVAPTPLRAHAAEEALAGTEGSEESLAGAAEIAAGECRPISDVRSGAEHRLELVRVLTLRALRAAVAAAGDGEDT